MVCCTIFCDSQAFNLQTFVYIVGYCCMQGYFGATIGKAKQAAKTEIEKIKV